MSKRIHLSSPHMGGEDEKYVKEAFDTNWIAPRGNNVNELAKQVDAYTGVKGACALSSGTGGIHIALDLLGVGENAIVFSSVLALIASATRIMYLGAKPVFIDPELGSWNMSALAL